MTAWIDQPDDEPTRCRASGCERPPAWWVKTTGDERDEYEDLVCNRHLTYFLADFVPASGPGSWVTIHRY